ncbi:S8 family peptidase [Streptomyces antimicrobicus]|uniref:S8 family peptidase n=1 Tax=Streptomyces antimicrobicus TaxID=2883108 RepID=A0ABS8BE96_9ACTN|nr:S8 family peptidase [Streptomyces antimicrobicus]MCB5182935.1 S8 family peptidase [Streptomyces antimicrobicus]
MTPRNERAAARGTVRTRRRGSRLLVPALLAGLAAGLLAGPAPAAAAAGSAAPDAPGGWIVVLKEPGRTGAAAAAPADTARDLLGRLSGSRLGHVYASALRGFSARMGRAQAQRLAADPRVAYVEPDTPVHLGERAGSAGTAGPAGTAGTAATPGTAGTGVPAGTAATPGTAGTAGTAGAAGPAGTAGTAGPAGTAATQPGAPWGLDRIDQRRLPLSTTYTYRTTAPGVRVYVIDTGLRTTHTEFGGRASVGVDTVGDGRGGQDCNGHGTHVGAIAAGTTYGVAKQARPVAVRVLDCTGSGTTSAVIAGVDWVTAHAVKPAVATMSIGGAASTALDAAVRSSIASGVTYTVAAGSAAQSGGACATSPSRVAEAVTVGATDRTDRKASSSNYGACVSLFAPGVGIPSAWHTGDAATATLSGTSPATAHAAGAAALHLAFRPADTPAQVKQALVANATTGVLQGDPPPTPNKLLYTLYLP